MDQPTPVTVGGLIGSAVWATFADWCGLMIYALPLIVLGLLHVAINASGVFMLGKEQGSLIVWWFPFVAFFLFRRLQLGPGAEWREPDDRGQLKLTTLLFF